MLLSMGLRGDEIEAMNQNIGFLYFHDDFRINGITVGLSNIESLISSFLTSTDSYRNEVGTFLKEWTSSSPFIRLQTSGSTGKPTEILMQKSAMIHSAKASAKFFEIPSQSTALLCLPASFIAGKMMIVRAMINGWDLLITKPSNNPLIGLDQEFDFGAMTPSQVRNSYEGLDKISCLIIGGAAVNSEMYESLQSYNTRIYETYGMTETVSHIAANRVNNKDKSHERHYQVLPGITISLDPRGCIAIKADYLGEQMVVTNDLVEINSINNTFTWLGRYDNVINSGGIKISPELLEKELASLIDVPFFIFGEPDEVLGERCVLCIESEVIPTGLLSKIKESKILPRHKLPKFIYSLRYFAYTSNGKIQRSNCISLLKEEK